MFPQNLPDRARMELHDADAEREMRRRASRGLLGQFAALCILCAVALVVLFLASLIL